jgi:hypothetical protein
MIIFLRNFDIFGEDNNSARAEEIKQTQFIDLFGDNSNDIAQKVLYILTMLTLVVITIL